MPTDSKLNLLTPVKFFSSNFKLEGNGLTVEPMSLDDTEELAPILGDEEVRRWFSTETAKLFATVEGVATFIGQRLKNCWEENSFPFTVKDQATGDVVATRTLFIDRKYRKSTMGYSATAAHRRGEGIATRAGGLTINWGFDSGINRVETHIATGNRASIKVSESLGLRWEGTRREDMQIADGSWVDMSIFARLASD